MSIIDRIKSLFLPRTYPLVEHLKMCGVDHATAVGIKQLLIDRRSRDETRKRVVQFAAKGSADYYELVAILEDEPGLIPEPSETAKRLAETNAVLPWHEFVGMLDLPPNT